MSIMIDCCVNIKNDLIKLVGKKWHMRCSTKCLLRFVCLILSKLSRMAHWWEDMKSKPFADVDMVCVPTWFNIVMIIIIWRFYNILTLDRNSYGYLQVLIPINLEDNHWVVARVDFQRKQISIYDSIKEFREDKTYGQLLKPLQVIFPQWLEDVGFYDIRPNLRSA